MDDKASVLAEVCRALTANKFEEASAILVERYPFVRPTNQGRKISVPQMLATFRRDGFIDRYSGARLVSLPALRLISKRLPVQFPFHPNWRMDSCHIALWELAPTVDHVVPVARGGANDESNWVTTSQLRNSAKANFTPEELGWSMCDRGNIKEWDGLSGWFVAQVAAEQTLLNDPYFSQWFRAYSAVTSGAES